MMMKWTPPVLFQQKTLPLAPQLVSSLAHLCQKGGEGEIYLRCLPFLSTLLTLEDGGPVREISLPPTRAPRFTNNTGEGSASSAQGGRNRSAINRRPPLKPPGTIETATKDKTKSKEKNTPS